MGQNILIIGGGFVGLTLGAKLLKTQTTSIAILESDIEKLRLLKIGNLYVSEPGLGTIFTDALATKRLKYTEFEEEKIYDAIFICVGTPPNTSNKNSSEKILDLVNLVNTCLKNNGLVFLRSTVTIGTTEKFSSSLISNGRADIKTYFAPERTAEGVALEELDKLPQIIGPTSNSAIDFAVDFLENFGFKLVCCSDSKSAEFVKLISNAWRDAVFGLSNEIALMSEIIGVDASNIIETANFDYPRANIPFPGPVGGPCLYKDSHILMESFTKDFKLKSIIYNARIRNEEIESRIYKVLLEHLEDSKSQDLILFIGAAFKGAPRTNDIRNGLTSNIISRIYNDKYPCKISIWDNTLNQNDLLHLKHLMIDSLDGAKAEVVVIGNNSKDLMTDDVLKFLNRLSTQSLIIDPWRIYKDFKKTSARIYHLGRGMINYGNE
jgi:UDP-N-acetyl-D-mannosaminuronic acid dehydrogenase